MATHTELHGVLRGLGWTEEREQRGVYEAVTFRRGGLEVYTLSCNESALCIRGDGAKTNVTADQAIAWAKQPEAPSGTIPLSKLTSRSGSGLELDREPRIGDVVARHFAGLPHECYSILKWPLMPGMRLASDDPELGGTNPVVARVVDG